MINTQNKTLTQAQKASGLFFASPGVESSQDYEPFGSLLPGRNWNSENYKHGFNGQMKSDEIAGSGNHNTAMFWEYDTRLGRRWNLDQVVKPHESPYATFANNPIWFIDPNGLDTIVNSNREKWNVGTGYKAIFKGHFLIGKSLTVKVWDKSIENFPHNGHYVDFQPWVSSFKQALKYSIAGCFSGVKCKGKILDKLMNDDNYLKFESEIISQIKNDDRWKNNKPFSGSRQNDLVVFGGNTSKTPMFIQGTIAATNLPISVMLFPDTWNVARHETTWIVRKTYLDVQFMVDRNKNICLHYSFTDIFDLEPDWKTQEAMYNIVVTPLGEFYHDGLGGRKGMKVQATWNKTIKP